jgi:hypothetical protein
MVLVLGFLIAFPVILWLVWGPAEGGRRAVEDRVIEIVILDVLVTLGLGFLLALWLGRAPTRISASTSTTFTVDGVAPEFARLWSEQERRAAAPAEPVPRFEATPYRPDGKTTYPAALRVLAGPTLLGAVFGLVLSFAARDLTEFTQGWARDDGRFVLVMGAIAAAYSVVLLALARPSRWMLPPLALLLAVVTLLIAGCAGVLAWFSVDLSRLTPLLLHGPALLLLLFVTYRLVKVYSVREPIVAGLGGLLGPVALAGVALPLLMPHDLSRHFDTVAFLSLCFAIANALAAVQQAGQPFCTRCDTWLGSRKLGVLRRSCQEVEPLVASGEVLRLSGVPIVEQEQPGDVALTLYSCPNCRDSGRLVLLLHEHVRSKSGRRQVGRWVYPGAALPALDEVFPPPADQPPRAPSADPSVALSGHANVERHLCSSCGTDIPAGAAACPRCGWARR